MDTLQPGQISVLEPVGAAIEKTKEILFRPFDLGKWFTLGFCAWLATLGESGGFGNFNFPNRSHGGSSTNFQHEWHNLKEGILNNLPIVLTVSAVVIVLVLVLAFVFMWLKSRGQFMFLHGVARNVAEVVNPWNRYARQGNSLFLFNVVLWLFGSFLGFILIAPLVFIFVMFAKTDFKVFAAAWIVPAVFLILGLICLAIVFAVVKILTKDFVIPIMYLEGCMVAEGWKRFWDLCKVHKSNFILFVLFLIVVGIVIGMLILLVILFTCCCAACIFAIPYIGTVALLPVLVWRRAYSALFLAQFGPEFDVFPKPQTVVVPSDLIPPQPPEQNF